MKVLQTALKIELDTHNTETQNPDGRIARTQRTRCAIADALLQLLEEGVDEPRAQGIAERAKVSVRTVFQHFDDIEGLYAEVVQCQRLRLQPFLQPVNMHHSLSERARTIVHQRDAIYAIASPIRNGIRNSSAARDSRTIARGFEELRAAMEQQIRQGFRNEFMHLGDMREALSRIEALTSFEMWHHLRFVQNLGRNAVRAQMLNMLMGELRPR